VIPIRQVSSIWWALPHFLRMVHVLAANRNGLAHEGPKVTRRRKIPAEQRGHGPSRFSAAVRFVRPLRPLSAALFPRGVALFVALFAWYLWAVVDLRLVFQARDMLFLWNVRYFTDFLGQPGSLLDWTDKLLVQVCYQGWPAVILLATVVWLLLVSTIGLMKALSRTNIGGTWIVPAALVVWLYGSGLFPTRVVVGITLAMAAANAWRRMPACRAWVRLVGFVALSVVLYYVAGEAYYCFAACCVIHEALTRKRLAAATLFVLAAVAVKFGLDAALARLNLASHNFHVFSLVKRHREPLDWRELALYLYFPACALVVVSRQAVLNVARAWWRRFGKSAGADSEAEAGKNDREKAWEDANVGRRRAWLRAASCWVGKTLLVLLPAATVAYFLFDRQTKLSQEIDYCAEHQRWEDVLGKARLLSPEKYTSSVNHDVNLALYHTGRMPYQLLRYPQRYQPLFTLGQVMPNIALLNKPISLLLELGRVSEAEHLAMELLEMQPCGKAIKHLAFIKMAKGHTAAARVFLNVLRDDLVWGDWAERHLQQLTTDPELAGEEEVQRLRGLMLAKDDWDRTSKPDAQGIMFSSDMMLLDLLKQNRGNRMAFEYLMSRRLLTGNLQGAAELFPMLNAVSYPSTPPLYEEAVILYSCQHPEEFGRIGADVSLGGRKVGDATMSKFRRLQAIAGPAGRLDEKMEPAVARELGDTYFYYFLYSSKKRS
jgi:hypothetical protein